jgi:hypothetical protein
MRLRALLCVLAFGGPAGGQQEFISARLSWQRSAGAEDCMTEQALRRAVAMRLRRDPFVETGGDVLLDGRIAAEAESGWIAELELHAPSGEPIGTRTLRTDAAHCSALDESLPLVVALMLDVPRDALRRAKSSDEPPVAEPERAAPKATPISLPRQTHAPREPWGFRLAALATGSVGLVPGLGLGAGLSVGIEPPAFWLTELDVVGWLPAEAESPDGGARCRLATVGLYLCPLSFESPPLRLDLCAGQRIGRMGAQGFGFDRNLEQVRLSYALGARARGWLTIAGPLLVGLGAGAEVPLARDEFFYSAANHERNQLFRMSPVVGAAEALLGVSLP